MRYVKSKDLTPPLAKSCVTGGGGGGCFISAAASGGPFDHHQAIARYFINQYTLLLILEMIALAWLGTHKMGKKTV